MWIEKSTPYNHTWFSHTNKPCKIQSESFKHFDKNQIV
jgi:hypothetical protein